MGSEPIPLDTLTLIILCIVTKFPIRKTNRCTSNIRNNKVPCFLLHVLEELCHLQGVYTPICNTHDIICITIVEYYNFMHKVNTHCARQETQLHKN